jgi:hypothetical protein
MLRADGQPGAHRADHRVRGDAEAAVQVPRRGTSKPLMLINIPPPADDGDSEVACRRADCLGRRDIARGKSAAAA